MTSTANGTWPPPPDLASLEELIATADVEGFLANGGPADEYEVEAEHLFQQIGTWPTQDLTTERLLPILETIWAQAFGLGDRALDDRRVKLRGLAAEIARFFGPSAQPQVRGS